LHLNLFEQPEERRLFQQPAEGGRGGFLFPSLDRAQEVRKNSALLWDQLTLAHETRGTFPTRQDDSDMRARRVAALVGALVGVLVGLGALLVVLILGGPATAGERVSLKVVVWDLTLPDFRDFA
jgi:hypothetical protein